MDLYQVGPNGWPMRNGEEYIDHPLGKIPTPYYEMFQNGMYGYEKPVSVSGWQYSYTFNCWSALVTFENGWNGFTYPLTWKLHEEEWSE